MLRDTEGDGTTRRRLIAVLAGVAFAGAIGTSVGSLAQQALPRAPAAVAQPVAQPATGKAAACDPARALGVSRTIDVDATGGPHFGHQQYKDLNILQDGEVILTFDDGPLRVHTQAVVNALEQHCTKATFFMVGSQAAANPDMVRQIIRKGHTVGTHTWSHANLRKMTPMSARQEIELGFSAVTIAAGQPIAPFFRFPYLADTRAMLGYTGTRNIGIFSIEVDSLDYRNKHNPQAVHDQVMSQLAFQKKGIILFHDIQPSTADAVPMVLRSLKAKGYRVVHFHPTAAASTVAEFDVMAQRHFDRKRIAHAANPLANRAVTWPLPPKPGQPQPAVAAGGVTGGPVPGGVSGVQRQPTVVGPGQYPPPIGQPAVLPGSAPLPGAAPYPAPAAAGGADQIPAPVYVRPTRQRPEDDWRTSIFSR